MQKAPRHSVDYSHTQAAATVAAGEWCCLDLAIGRLNGDGAEYQGAAASVPGPAQSACSGVEAPQAGCAVTDSELEGSRCTGTGQGSSCCGAARKAQPEVQAPCGIELLVQWSRECWRAGERGLDDDPGG